MRSAVNNIKGFTLIELMVVVVIITILAVIAVPTYKNYIRRADLSQAQQDMQKIADQLERYKGRNFSYNGFKIASVYDTSAVSSIDENQGMLYLPIGSNSSTAKYILTLVDAEKSTPLSMVKSSAGDDGYLEDGLGHSWKMKAVSRDLANYSLVMNSDGLQCKTIDQTQVNLYKCASTGAGEPW